VPPFGGTRFVFFYRRAAHAGREIVPKELPGDTVPPVVEKNIIMPTNHVRLYVHLVWATWDRHPLIVETWEDALHRYIEGICRKLDCDVLAVGGTENHVHLLVRMPATLCVADLVEAVKGGSSRYAAGLTNGSFKWQGSYGAFTVSARDRETVVRYICRQKEHHAAGTVWDAAEQMCEE
jgi:REP element-mobilizing transposase RayT